MNPSKILIAAIRKLLRPLIRILLKNGIPYGAFVDIVKPMYVESAAALIESEGKKQTNSRISTITGLSRKEVHRLKELDDSNDVWTFDRYNRAARVVSGWVRDTRFADCNGQPASLPYDDATPCFTDLVTAFSGDIPARTIYDELNTAGVVKKLENGKVKLLSRAYIPATDQSEKLGILGTDVAGLISTISHNIYETDQKPFFQRKVYYDNLPDEAIPKLQALIEKRAQALLEDVDQWMSAHDRDTNPTLEGQGRNATGIGIFYFQNEPPEE
ncbi:MAG: hypothetical protein GXP08_00640 [Gammaproteobacteria bacterium]|nr:hypothetical protein [Gammaproteobacteria bacterium]